MSIVSCKETDCQHKVQARGMCRTHYSYWQRANAKHTMTCVICGDPFTHNRKDRRTCSAACRIAMTLANEGWQQRSLAEASRKGADIVLRLRAKTWLGQKVPPRKGGALVAGQCAYCPTYFVGSAGSRYCSDRCANNAAWKRRYDQRGEFKVTDKLRLSIYERDSYTCQLCRQPVDITVHYQHLMSPTLDHIIPQSHQLIPDHTAKNLRLAHRLCNSVRGDRLINA